MNDKPGGTPSPFSFAPQPGPTPNPAPSPAANSFSPSNFGSKPAPALATPPKPRPTPSPAELRPSTGAPADSAPAPKPAAPTPAAAAPGPAELRPTSNAFATMKAASKPATPGTTPAKPTTLGAKPATIGATKPATIGATKPATTGVANTGATANTAPAPNPAANNAPTKPATLKEALASNAKPAPAPDNPFNPTVSDKPNPFLNLKSESTTSAPRTTVTTDAAKDSKPLDPFAPNIAKRTELEPADRPLVPPSSITLQPEQPPKKKTGLVVGAIATFVVLLVGVVAGVFFLKFSQKDPVAMAVDKLLTGQAPANLQVTGTISGYDGTIMLRESNCQIDIDAGINISSLANQADLSITCDHLDEDTVLEISEITTTKNTFFRTSGLSDFVEALVYTPYDTDNEFYGDIIEEDDESITVQSNDEDYATSAEDFRQSLSNLMMQIFLVVFGQVDSEWIRLDDSGVASSIIDFGAIAPGNTSCSSELLSSIRSNYSLVADLYQKAPFISSTTENVTVSSKNSTVYQVVLDDKKYHAFIQALERQGVFDDYIACVKETTAVDNCIDSTTGEPVNCIAAYDEDEDADNDNNTVTESPLNALYNLPADIPTLYVEIDKDYNFTRAYWKKTSDDAANYSADLSFSYPDTLEITEPDDYLDFDELFNMNLFEAMWGGFDEEEDDTDQDSQTNTTTSNGNASSNSSNSTEGDDEELIFFDEDDTTSVTPTGSEFVSGLPAGESATNPNQVDVSD